MFENKHSDVASSAPLLRLAEPCRRLAASSGFQNGVLGLIVVNAIVMGLEAWPLLAAGWTSTFAGLNAAVQVAFVLELVVRIVGHYPKPLSFFRSGWNVFDFVVVAFSLLPVAGPFATVARLARVLRAARLISGLPELRLIVATLLRSIPSMGHVVLLLSLLVYVYGVVGFHLFGRVDPEHWGSLARAARTLFFVITLEGWVDILRASEAATAWAWLYYMSFIVIAVFVVINLFIAVVTNNLEKARSEEAAEPAREPADVEPVQLREIASELVRLRRTLEALEKRTAASGERRLDG